jgi:hypothetical protein
MGNLSPDLFQIDSPWVSAATPADEITHLKERSQRFSSKSADATHPISA